ncbi:hypothetical protein MLD38_021135 [Melastoma candidum]|uniref:Uncharacterized protein n=1 Tax=Melastoma candidum TaxID=119954 RepID=A0ACB9QED6_9MYRT|nr:hypothetical protein MLD38_021135 [Melastoma candidum]
MSFTKLTINLIKILSGIYLLAGCGSGKAKSSEGPNDFFELSSISDREDSCDDFVSRAVKQCCSLGSKPSEKTFELSRDGRGRLDVCSSYSLCSSEMATSSGGEAYLSKIRFDCSLNSKGEVMRHTDGICSVSTTSCLDNPVSNGKKQTVSMDLMVESDCSQDPFAFDDDEFQPSKWDLLYGKKKPRKSKSSMLAVRDENGSQEASSSRSISEGDITLVTDCLLSSVKVLMNLTNDNPLGCEQIAEFEGVETMASVIASHFPMFCSSGRNGLDSIEKNPCCELSCEGDKDLSDQELNLSVAILGMLVNLVEKDGSNSV